MTRTMKWLSAVPVIVRKALQWCGSPLVREKYEENTLWEDRDNDGDDNDNNNEEEDIKVKKLTLSL
jgi:hypothetical protein